jgi:xylulokinase
MTDNWVRVRRSGCGGLVVLRYVEEGSTLAGLPSTDAVYGIAAHFARATVEGVLCGLAEALDALTIHDGHPPQRILLVGGAARSEAVRRIAPTLFGQSH